MDLKFKFKEVLVKALGYRVLVVIFELFLATFLAYFSTLTLFSFIIVNNLIKYFGYVVYELIWIGIVRTRLNLIDRFRRWLDGN